MPNSARSAGHDLVERAEETALLAGILEQVATSRTGATALVLGEPGAGKSTLLGVVSDWARARGVRAWAASAGELESHAPYGVVRRLFDRPLLDLTEEQRRRLGQGPGRLGVDHLLGLDSSPVEQSDLLTSLAWLLDGLAADGPILLVVDDAQWADEESLLFLGSLRERLRALPIMIVIAARDVAAAERGAALAHLVANREASVLRLRPLSAAGVNTLLASSWGGSIPPEVGAAAVAVTGGNPFLVLALAGLLEQCPEHTAEQVHAAVPGSVIDSVTARLASLDAPARDLARAVAVLEVSSTGVAGRLAGLSLDQASAAADQLRAAGLLADLTALQYRHALLRGAVYSATPPGLRDQLHRAAARLLADDLHAAAAQQAAAPGSADPWAVELLRRAAAAATAEGAPHSAVGLLRRAVAEPPDTEALPGVLLELGLAEMRTTDPACVPTLQRAEGLVMAPADRARCALALAQAHSFAGLHEEAAAVLDRASAALADADAEVRLAVEVALVAASLLVPERIAAGRRLLAGHSGLSGSTPGERLLLIQQLANAAGTNQPAETIHALAVRAIADSDSPESTDWVWARLFLAAVGEFDDVRRLTDDGFAKAADRGSVIGFVTASFVRGLAELWAGALVSAEAHFVAMDEASQSLTGGPLLTLLGAGNLAQTLAWQGRAEEALAALAPFPEDLPAGAPVNGLMAMWFGRATTRDLTGDHAGALRAARSAGRLVAELDVDSPTWAPWRSLAIGPLRSLGHLDEARRLAAEHLALCERSGVGRLVGEALRLCGEVDEDPDRTIALLRSSVEVLGPTQSRLQQALSQVALGSALRRSGRRTEARPHLYAGRELARDCGALPLAGRAEAELAAGGSRVRRLELTGVPALTSSELRVAELAAQGLRNNDIARQLFVATKTVETHLSRSYRKLGVTGREDLAAALGG